MNINYKIGDCREVLKDFEEGVFDACVTDPPYGLEFMGKEWDKLFTTRDRRTDSSIGRANDPYIGAAVDKYMAGIEAQNWHHLWAKQVYRVLKPGGYLLAFGGTRTYHRMVCAVEDAGFEIRDTIAWVYGSGFPKSMDISKQIDKMAGIEPIKVEPASGVGFMNPEGEGGWHTTKHKLTMPAPTTPDAKKWSGYGTALKPAVEPIVVARKPIAEKNVAMNVLTHGVGGINVDGCRIGFGGEDDRRSALTNYRLDHSSRIYGAGDGYHKASNHLSKEVHTQGRFPANIILECTCEKVIPGKLVGNGHVPKVGQAASKGIFGAYAEQENEERYLKEHAPIHTNPNCPCYVLDAQSGDRPVSGSAKAGKPATRGGYDVGNTVFPMGVGKNQGTLHNDRGGASRYFYVAKASRRERWFYCSVCKKAYSGDKREAHKKHSMHCLDCGVDYEPEYPLVQGRDGAMRDSDPFAMVGRLKEYNKPIDDHREHKTKTNLLFHVTQKPEQLIRYLIRLVTPKGGTVLDPFVGSGTTLVAARMEGMNALGVEIGVEYEPLIKGRLNALPRALEEFHQPTTTPSPNESIKYTQETE